MRSNFGNYKFRQFWHFQGTSNFLPLIGGFPYNYNAGALNCVSVETVLRGVSRMAKVFTIPVVPDPLRRRKVDRSADPRYIEGQRLLVEAMKYLAKDDPQGNRNAIELLSEHFRTQFRMTDRPN